MTAPHSDVTSDPCLVVVARTEYPGASHVDAAPPPPGQANVETNQPARASAIRGREAGRRCTRCGRPACTECLVQATVGSHCVECAKAAKPDVKTRARYWSARQPTLVTYT